MIKVAINGFGRIGRPALKIALTKPDIEVVAINDLGDVKTLAHLLKYDSSYGIFDKKIEVREKSLIIDGKEIKCFAEKDPAALPWKDLGVDVIIESTGLFTKYDDAKKHLAAGAKKVVISAPTKSKEIPTYVLGVNAEKYDARKDNIISNSSCTTNCLAPVAKVLNDNFGIERGFLNTCHSYTNDQRILDLPHKDLRRARAAGLSMIPTTTGAAKDTAKVIPELAGKLDGISIRVPTPTVSLVDFTAVLKKTASIEEINTAFKKVASSAMKGILSVCEEPLVSIDFKGNPYSAIIDAPSTAAINNLVKIIAWYDNEMGYANRLVEMAEYVGQKF